jgi:hypothetical protein
MESLIDRGNGHLLHRIVDNVELFIKVQLIRHMPERHAKSYTYGSIPESKWEDIAEMMSYVNLDHIFQDSISYMLSLVHKKIRRRWIPKKHYLQVMRGVKERVPHYFPLTNPSEEECCDAISFAVSNETISADCGIFLEMHFSRLREWMDRSSAPYPNFTFLF